MLMAFGVTVMRTAEDDPNCFTNPKQITMNTVEMNVKIIFPSTTQAVSQMNYSSQMHYVSMFFNTFLFIALVLL